MTTACQLSKCLGLVFATILMALCLAPAASGDSGLNGALSSSFACEAPDSQVTFKTENRQATFRLKKGGAKHMTFFMRDVDPCYVGVSPQAGGPAFSVTVYSRSGADKIQVYRGSSMSRQPEGVVACFASQAAADRFAAVFMRVAGCEDG